MTHLEFTKLKWHMLSHLNTYSKCVRKDLNSEYGILRTITTPVKNEFEYGRPRVEYLYKDKKYKSITEFLKVL